MKEFFLSESECPDSEAHGGKFMYEVGSHLLYKGVKVIFVVGAGISVSSGIPQFSRPGMGGGNSNERMREISSSSGSASGDTL